jgi:hypothetical protein
MTDPAIQHISDTARWAAVYRARETERNDALFRDPFARRLAGECYESSHLLLEKDLPFAHRAPYNVGLLVLCLWLSLKRRGAAGIVDDFVNCRDY